MEANIIKQDQQQQEIVQKLVLDGDLSRMTPLQKVEYYNRFCQSLGLNHLTQPFQIIKFQGKERLYATKDCTEQLRKIHGVSITDVNAQELRGVYVVTAKAMDKNGKTDAATGVVNIEGLKGEALANALMKAETKAKRRVTLSICGLGLLDESEMDTMKGATTAPITEDVPHVEVATTPANMKQPKDATANNATEDISMWETFVAGIGTIENMKEIYRLNKKTIDASSAITKLFADRKKELEAEQKKSQPSPQEMHS